MEWFDLSGFPDTSSVAKLAETNSGKSDVTALNADSLPTKAFASQSVKIKFTSDGARRVLTETTMAPIRSAA